MSNGYIGVGDPQIEKFDHLNPDFGPDNPEWPENPHAFYSKRFPSKRLHAQRSTHGHAADVKSGAACSIGWKRNHPER